MIDIWLVCVGDKYGFNRVEDSQRMISKNLVEKHRFNVITDSVLPGWWAKMEIFSRCNPGRNLYFDLDVVITGNLDCLLPYCDNALSMPKNWGNNGGFQSSVMAWNGEIHTGCFDPSNIGEPNYQTGRFGTYGAYSQHGTLHHGDQEFLTHNFSDQITEISKGLVVSYKYHARNHLPQDARAVCFHGKPDYWECGESWIKKALC